MRSIWKHKWIVVPVVVAIILAAGAVSAVALAGPGNNTAVAESSQLVTASTSAVQPAAPAQSLQTLRERLRARLQNRLDLLKQRWARIRATMTPEDQTAFDQLQQTAKDQQAAVQKARQDLLSTLQQMRALIQKYRPQAANRLGAASGQVQ